MYAELILLKIITKHVLKSYCMDTNVLTCPYPERITAVTLPNSSKEKDGDTQILAKL